MEKQPQEGQKIKVPRKKIRIPQSLRPSYRALMSTPEGAATEKRIKVDCGICKTSNCHSIYTGVTKVASVFACEKCRHFYQKIRRNPVDLDCVEIDKTSCYQNGTVKKCKGCWAARLLDCCPHSEDVYKSISSLLSDNCKKGIRGLPLMPEELHDDETGAIALVILKNGSWVPAPSPPDNDTSHLVGSMEDEMSQHDSNSDDVSDLETEESSKNILDSKATECEANEGISRTTMDASSDSISEEEDIEKSMEEEVATLVERENEKNDECSISSVDKDGDQMDGTTAVDTIFMEGENNEMATLNIPEDAAADDDDDDEPSTKDSEEEEEETTSKGAADNIEEDLETGNGGNSNAELNSEITYKIATISSQAFEDAEIEEEEAMVDDPAPVYEGIVTRRRKDSYDDEIPQSRSKKSQRIKRKRRCVEHFSKPSVTAAGRSTKGLIHGPDGAILKNGKDLCDCLQEDCPGCHFPCPKCRSPKCGSECRVNRRWYYEKVEVEGTKIFWINKFAP